MSLPPVVSDPEYCPRRPFIEGEEHVWEWECPFTGDAYWVCCYCGGRKQ